MTNSELNELQFINEAFVAEAITAAQLDLLLADGWRHFGTHFHRYNISLYEDNIVRVLPLRIRLADISFSKSQRRVLNKNADLTTMIGPAEIGPAEHELFAWHKRRFLRDVPDSIYTFLSEDPANIPTKGLMLRVMHGDQLLAASFFECGENSMSSIYGMFYPLEAARGLGTLTMLKEIEYAREIGLDYYYHGYAYDHESFYDYKKRFAALEYFDWNGNWLPL